MNYTPIVASLRWAVKAKLTYESAPEEPNQQGIQAAGPMAAHVAGQ